VNPSRKANEDVSPRPTVAVLIPCYNEETTIAGVVEDFRSALPDSTIFVYDNNPGHRTGSTPAHGRPEHRFDVIGVPEPVLWAHSRGRDPWASGRQAAALSEPGDSLQSNGLPGKAAVLHPKRGSIVTQFVRFGVVGVVGFAVDAGVLALLLHLSDAGPYLCRAGSFLCAATVTWYMNRTFTFGASSNGRLAREWLRFLSANALGGGVNLGAYSTLVATVRLITVHPVIGVGIGSICGLGVNFMLSRAYIFRDARNHIA
jgi:putative flippase GtrA